MAPELVLFGRDEDEVGRVEDREADDQVDEDADDWSGLVSQRSCYNVAPG